MKNKLGKLILPAIILIFFLNPDIREWFFQLVQKNNFVDMQEYIRSFGIWGPVISMLLMTINTMIIPLPTFIITVANALIYGWQWGVVISWSGAMMGAAINFGIAKIYGRPAVERLIGKKSLAVADGFFERYGKHTIIITRLIPIMSFGIISYVAGLTSIRFWTYFWATGVGQAPATIIYSFIAFSIADEILAGDAIISPPVLFWALVAVLVLGVFAMAAKGFLVEKPKEAQDGEVNG
ncbi:MAG: TVP38/TMEM64 family protein [Clostridia bacterium]|nr:TVP38/TMEM64 family protein [Clostridia bacterium]